MSLDIIKNYLEKQMLSNENFKQLISTATNAIEEYEKESRLYEEHDHEMQRATVELHLAECMRMERDVETDELEENAKGIREMYTAFLSLLTKIRLLDLKDLFDSKAQLMEVEIEKEINKMQIVREHQQNVYKIMENRGIVQILRTKQQELLVAQQNLERTKSTVKETAMVNDQKIRIAQCKLQNTIVKLITGVKEVEHLQNNLHSIKIGEPVKSVVNEVLVKKPQQVDNFKPPQTFFHFLAEYKKQLLSASVSPNNTQQIPSILNNTLKVDNMAKNDDAMKPKRVTFSLQTEHIVDVSMNSNDDKDGSVENVPTFENLLTSTPTRSPSSHITQSTADNEVIDTFTHENLNDDVSETSSSSDDTFIEDSDNNSNQTTIDNNTGGKSKVPDQQTIKPAEKVLPKNLLNVSSATSITSDDQSKRGKTIVGDQFNTMLADIMNSFQVDSPMKNADKNSPTNEQIMSQSVLDMLAFGSSGFATVNHDNSFDLLDSDVAQDSAVGHSKSANNFL